MYPMRVLSVRGKRERTVNKAGRARARQAFTDVSCTLGAETPRRQCECYSNTPPQTHFHAWSALLVSCDLEDPLLKTFSEYSLSETFPETFDLAPSILFQNVPECS